MDLEILKIASDNNNNKNNKVNAQHDTDDCPYKTLPCPTCKRVGNHHPSNCKSKRKREAEATGGETVNTTTRKGGSPSKKKKKCAPKCKP